MAAGVTLAWLAVAPALLGSAAHDLAVGAVAGLLPLTPGLWWWRRLRPRAHGIAVDARAFAAAAVAGSLLASVALTTWLWDERSTHFGLTAAMARGVLPPVHPQLPDAPFPYHTGFDALAALAVRMTGLPVDVALDVTSLAVAAVLLASLAAWGRELCGSVGARAAPLLVLGAYGPAALCVEAVQGVVPDCSALVPERWVHFAYVPPPLVSAFFQHPQALGMVLFVTSLRLFFAGGRAARALSCIVIAALAHAQIVFFAVCGAALALASVVDAVRRRDGRALAERAITLGVALAGAALTARFFVRPEAPPVFHFVGHFTAAYGAGPAGAVLWHAILFPGALAGLAFAARATSRADPMRVALAAAAVIAFMVPNIVSYERSWDIVKFFSVAMFAGNLLFLDVLAAVSRIARAALAALAGVTSLVWLLRFGALNGVIAPAYTERAPDAVAVAFAARFADVVGDGRVLTRRGSLQEAGVMLAAVDPREVGITFLFDREQREQRFVEGDRVLRAFDVDGMRALGASFAFLSVDDAMAMSPEARARATALTSWTLEVGSARFVLVRLAPSG